jgi:hypothetical protein
MTYPSINVRKFINLSKNMNDQHTHTGAGIPLVALITIYEHISSLRTHRIGITYVAGQQWKWM